MRRDIVDFGKNGGVMKMASCAKEKGNALAILAGIVFLAASLMIGNLYLSAAMGVTGCSCLWSILELKEQEKRVKKGWFPKNPRRKK